MPGPQTCTPSNPWLRIPLEEYEGHMASPGVDQARLIAQEFGRALRETRPESVAVLGCAGGNGFEQIDSSVTRRVLGVDINPEYLDAVAQRFAGVLPGLELRQMDLQSGRAEFPPVDLVFVALVLEYVELEPSFAHIRAICRQNGTVTTLIQLASAAHAPVSPSPYASLEILRPVMRLTTAERVAQAALHAGLRMGGIRELESTGGKRFVVQTFLRTG